MAATSEMLSATDNQALDLRHGIQIGDWRLLLPAGQAAELVSQPDITPLAYLPVWCLGLINWHGNVLPVFDWASLLGATSAVRPYRVLVLGTAPHFWALCLKNDPQRLTALQPLPLMEVNAPPLLQPYLLGGYGDGQHTWLDIAYDSLLWHLKTLAGLDGLSPATL